MPRFVFSPLSSLQPIFCKDRVEFYLHGCIKVFQIQFLSQHGLQLAYVRSPDMQAFPVYVFRPMNICGRDFLTIAFQDAYARIFFLASSLPCIASPNVFLPPHLSHSLILWTSSPCPFPRNPPRSNDLHHAFLLLYKESPHREDRYQSGEHRCYQ